MKTPEKYPFITYGKRDYCWSRQHDPSIYDGDDYADLRGCLKTVRFGRVAWSWS
jgi:hypothetical protein